MNFGDALQRLNAGGKITRTGWNRKGMWLELQTPDEHSKMTQPYVFITTGRDELGIVCRVPWVASQPDLLGKDWIEVEGFGSSVVGAGG